MGGSMYERRDSVPHHSSLRDRMRAELEAFGPYAVRTDTNGVDLAAYPHPHGEVQPERRSLHASPSRQDRAPEPTRPSAWRPSSPIDPAPITQHSS